MNVEEDETFTSLLLPSSKVDRCKSRCCFVVVAVVDESLLDGKGGRAILDIEYNKGEKGVKGERRKGQVKKKNKEGRDGKRGIPKEKES
jgi:hypothetical protein